jgi:hypothetical protein
MKPPLIVSVLGNGLAYVYSLGITLLEERKHVPWRCVSLEPSMIEPSACELCAIDYIIACAAAG